MSMNINLIIYFSQRERERESVCVSSIKSLKFVNAEYVDLFLTVRRITLSNPRITYLC